MYKKVDYCRNRKKCMNTTYFGNQNIAEKLNINVNW
jgi:hypothetical protein